MINFDKYDEAFNKREKSVLEFHTFVADHYRNTIDKHKLLLSLGPDIYTDTGQDELDFKCLAFSIGSKGESLAREKYELYKQ